MEYIYLALDVSGAAFYTAHSLINRRITKHYEIN